VVAATALFPTPTSAEHYRKIADKELKQPLLRNRSGKRLDAAAVDVDRNDIDGRKLISSHVAAPANANRLLRGSENNTPVWYSVQKIKLTTSMNASFNRQGLTDVLESISKSSGVRFVIDTPVSASRAHLDSRLTLNVDGLPAETILDIACQKGGVEYVIMEKSIVITTPARALDYLRNQTTAVRNNWAYGKMLFPDLNPELFADAPKVAVNYDDSTRIRGALDAAKDENVAPYLLSGKAFVDHIRQLLR
jgi:hypothetical protein